MASTNSSTVPVINPFTGKPTIQRFLDDPQLYALACEEGCADMTETELEDMDAWVDNRMREDSGLTVEEWEAAAEPLTDEEFYKELEAIVAAAGK